MQCPSCGFENIPGSEQCCVCSALLSSRQSGETVFPPRARDRSFWQRVRWSLTTSAGFTRAVGRLQALRRSLSNVEFRRRLSAARPQVNLHEIGLLLLSVIPGLGHVYVVGDVRRGRRILLGSLGALVLAMVAYRTILADVLVYGIIALSMFCVFVVADRLREIRGEEAQFVRRVGIALLVLAVYLGSYVLLRSALSSRMMVVRIEAEPWSEVVSAGDSLLLTRHDIYRRGDIVAGAGYWQHYQVPNVGPIIGVPGDRIEVADRVYVNGMPTGARPRHVESSPSAEVTLAEDEYWLMPGLNINQVVNREMVASAGVIQDYNVWGRAVAVVGPPGHRRWLSRVPLMGE